MKALTLRDLKKGEYATIENITDTALKLKLMEMGCIPGEIIKLAQIAPLGDPIAIEVQGYRLSLRLSEAGSIKIKMLPKKPNIIIPIS
jgi:ferrous iron transport protein A